ncbi:MAG: GC-type dockerin domain-anchored protein [Planctomycetota bacterium]
MFHEPWRAAAAIAFAACAAVAHAQSDSTCRVDLDGDGEVTLFDFIEFQNLFDAMDPIADFDGDGRFTVFDFLEFQNEFNQGCPEDPIATQLAGIPLGEYPWFEYTRAFNAGQTVQLAIDPDRFPSIFGETGDIYIVAAKSEAEWAGDPSLVDVRAGGPQEHTFDALGISSAAVLLDGSAALPAGDGLAIGRGYDVVVDVDRDGVLGDGDFIDGLGLVRPDENGFSVFVDLTTPGPLTPTMIDTSVSAGVIRLNYPAEIATEGPLPLCVIIHGGGHDYRWYDYLQDHLSSWGWVSISGRNDFSGTGNSPLRYTDAIIAQQGTVAGGVLDGLIDTSRIFWIGHSLGGREICIGAERLHRGLFTPANYTQDDIVMLSSIAANSIGDFGSLDADPGPLPFHMIWGSADGDRSGAPDVQAVPFRHYDRATSTKLSTYIHGADHNDFNCCGFNNFTGPPATEIGRDEAQRIAKAIWIALAKIYGEGETDAIDYLTRQWESFRPLTVSSGTTVVHMYRPDPDADGSVVIDDFQTNPSTATSSSGGTVSLTVSNAEELRLMDGGGGFTWQPTDPANGMTYAWLTRDFSRGLVFDYMNTGRSIEFEVPAVLRDVSALDHLSFRACQGTRHPNTTAELEDLTFTVSLIDGSGASSAIHIGAYGGGIEEVYQRSGSGTGTGWQNEFETIRIRLTDFLAEGAGVDLSDVAAVRFDFGPSFGSDLGRLGLDEVEFTVDP